jgi:DNA-binding MarR family transcriptional regulator
MTSDDDSTPTPDTRTTADALADDLERIAVGAVGLTTRALAHADAGFELTFPQWRALLALGENPDGARVGEVAGRVGVTLPATSRLLRRLERRGLTTLGVDETDRRATRARLTDSGRAVRAAILGHRRAALGEVVSALHEPERLDLPEGLRVIAAELLDGSGAASVAIIATDDESDDPPAAVVVPTEG